MNTREANNDSHSTTPSPYKASGKLITTLVNLTQQNHSSDTFVSTDVVCASVPHHPVLIESSVIVTDQSGFIIGTSEFVQATPHECAPAVEAPAPFAVTVGAINSGVS